MRAALAKEEAGCDSEGEERRSRGSKSGDW